MIELHLNVHIDRSIRWKSDTYAYATNYCQLRSISAKQWLSTLTQPSNSQTHLYLDTSFLPFLTVYLWTQLTSNIASRLPLKWIKVNLQQCKFWRYRSILSTSFVNNIQTRQMKQLASNRQCHSDKILVYEQQAKKTKGSLCCLSWDEVENSFKGI